ncbi:MAG: site-specific DNA-methyltransferase [Thermotogaceae bacterium]|nr:site-specific DNA-methyltransferase [Thermotogaceae bacterium]
MAELPENSVDTILTDPPYGLTFMGKDWDRGVPGVAFWEQALRVAKPGAMLLAMGGTRTFHRLVCAIEDAGWEVRDSMAWLYGSGFPKSYDISKGIDKQAGAKREVVGERQYASPAGNNDNFGVGDNISNPNKRLLTAPATPEAQLWDGWGTALKPAFEPIVIAMKPIDGNFVNNALTWGVAGLWIDGGRVKSNDVIPKMSGKAILAGTSEGWDRPWKSSEDGLKRRKIAADIAIDKANQLGRFPANVIHDGSDEVTGLFPIPHGAGHVRESEMKPTSQNIPFKSSMGTNYARFGDSGSAARFFYCAKASRSERNAGLEGMPEKVGGGMQGTADQTLLTGSGNIRNNKMQNHHPTVKPLALMRYLARLTKTPTGGVVLDPFMGSGTTGMAAVLEGRDFIGIELNAEYLEIAEKRIAHVQGSIPVELPLFAEAAE